MRTSTSVGSLCVRARSTASPMRVLDLEHVVDEEAVARHAVADRPSWRRPRRDMVRESGVPIEYSLFSQTKTMGSFQRAASEQRLVEVADATRALAEEARA